MRNKVEKEIKDMTSNEAKEDFYELLSEDEVGLLLEYLYTVVGYDLSYRDDRTREIVSYYRDVKNRASLVTERIYKNTNEHLTTLFSKIDVKGKKVATVGSSGDQALNAIYHGAKQVDLIDANVLTRPFVELKIAAIKGLEFEDYLEFINNIEQLPKESDFKYYAKFANKLPDDMKLFWDFVMLDENGISDKLFQSIFYEDEVIIKNAGEYYDSIKFDKMKEILNREEYKLNYIIAEFNDFPNKLKSKYDYILLSNIADYVADYDINGYANVVSKLYKNNLIEGGSLQVTSAVRYKTNDYFHVFIKKQDAKDLEYEDTGLYGNSSLFMYKPLMKEDAPKREGGRANER